MEHPREVLDSGRLTVYQAWPFLAFGVSALPVTFCIVPSTLGIRRVSAQAARGLAQAEGQAQACALSLGLRFFFFKFLDLAFRRSGR